MNPKPLVTSKNLTLPNRCGGDVFPLEWWHSTIIWSSIFPNYLIHLTLDFSLRGHGSHADHGGSADRGNKGSGEHFSFKGYFTLWYCEEASFRLRSIVSFFILMLGEEIGGKNLHRTHNVTASHHTVLLPRPTPFVHFLWCSKIRWLLELWNPMKKTGFFPTNCTCTVLS